MRLPLPTGNVGKLSLYLLSTPRILVPSRKGGDHYSARLADISRAEGLIPKEFGRDAVEIPGSRAMLDSLEKAGVPWAIVTSGTRALVTGWLDGMKLAHPTHLVTAEDVSNGKPDPACYQLGKTKLDVKKHPSSIVVFEDAPAGIQAGKAAGFTVVGLFTTHTLEQLKEAGADYIVKDMESVKLLWWDQATGEGELEVVDAYEG